MASQVTPESILHLGLAFWGSKALLSAVELQVFSKLADGPLSTKELRVELGIDERAASDFFDALTALGMLDREGETYRNTAEADLFLDKAKPSYLGGMLEMANERLYPAWGGLTEALRTGKPRNGPKDGEEDFFAALYSNPEGLRLFLGAMTGISMGAAAAIAEKFPWGDYKTFADLGGAQGGLPVAVAGRHAHLSGLNFDLPPVGPVCEEYFQAHGLGDRLKFEAGNFFHDELPATDVMVMGHILHDWNLDEKKTLIKRVHEALPEGGAFIVYEALIDDERCQNAFGLLMSLNMLVETPGGFDYTGADCSGWMREAGFRETRVEQLVGPDSMVVGIK